MADVQAGTAVGEFDLQSGKTISEPAGEAAPTEAKVTEEPVKEPEVKAEEPAQEPVKEEEPAEDNEEVKEASRREQEMKKMLIDSIEEKMKAQVAGKMSPAELRQWFKDHPDFADIANKSKRIKESYRELMSSQEETETTKIPAEDLEKTIEQKIDERLNQKTLKEHSEVQEKLAVAYAGKYGLKDEKFDSLKNNANALQQANPDWSYNECLAASRRVVERRKASSVNLSTRTLGAAPEVVEKKVDLTEGFEIKL